MDLLKEGSHAAVTIQWPLLYANNELVGIGTLLEVSSLECRVAGTMPVATGMHLRVWISPTNRNDALYVKEARVVWTRQNEFGLEMVDVDADDRQWLTRFFERC